MIKNEETLIPFIRHGGDRLRFPSGTWRLLGDHLHEEASHQDELAGSWPVGSRNCDDRSHQWLGCQHVVVARFRVLPTVDGGGEFVRRPYEYERVIPEFPI